MGGKALQNANTRRYMANEYHALKNELIILFHNEGYYLREIPAYRQKESFGDMDLVIDPIKSKKDVNGIRSFIETLSPQEIVTNGGVTSFEYKNLQIDLINAGNAPHFAVNYFAFNDLGNFIGRTAHRLGFKFGHDGLWYVLRDPDNQAYVWEELLVTDSFSDALDFLGFDILPHFRGFNTKEEIFKYATSSEYFDPAQFVLSNRSSEARRRDSTRQMYKEMLEYLEARYPDLNNMERKPRDYEHHLERALDRFKDFDGKYWASRHALAKKQRFVANFNGQVVGDLFGLEGKELGQQMKGMRLYFEGNDLTGYVGDLPQFLFKQWCLLLNKYGMFDRG